MAIQGHAHLRPIPWKAAILDEAHRLKSRNSKVRTASQMRPGLRGPCLPDEPPLAWAPSHHIRQIGQMLRGLKLEHRVLLTGTPLQNNLEELWSLLNFIHPAGFPSSEAFLREFGSLKSEEDVARLQAVLKPLMLRRLKDDVVRRALKPVQRS